MSGLADLLADAAAEAKLYGDPERAVRVLRRRRRLARLTPLAIAVVVLVAVPLTYVSLHRPPTQMTPSGIVNWLPARLAPATDPPPLPADRPVGRASLVYVGQDRLRGVLVTADLAQYRVGISQVPILGLSPDGRWLLSVVDNRVMLRDLTGTATLDLFALPDRRVNAAWSPDSHTVAVQPMTSQGTTMVVDLDSLRSHQITMPIRLCGAQDTGKLLGCSTMGEPVSVTLVDAATGERGRTVAADLSSVLTPAEQQAVSINPPSTGAEMEPVSGGEVMAVRTNVYHPEAGVTVPGDLLLFDVATGRFLRRIALPPTEVGRMVPQSGGVAFMAAEGRGMGAGLPEGIPLVHVVPVGEAHPSQAKVTAVEFADPSTGARVQVMTVSGTVTELFVRGGQYA